MQTFVVPLDGSPAGEAAIAPAIRLAGAFGAQLCLLSSTLGGAIESIDEYLERVAGNLADFAGPVQDPPLALPDVTTSCTKFVWPAAAILEALDSLPDAAACMATHGRSGFGRLALGSVADEVVGVARNPVVLVGPEAELVDVRGQRMVLCWESIEIDPALLATSTAWALALDLEIVVLHVRGVHDARDGGEFAEWQDARQGVIDELVAAGIRAGGFVVDGHDVAEEIVQYARTRPTALIAMGCRPHAANHNGPLDNVALRTVRHAPRPLLIQSPAR